MRIITTIFGDRYVGMLVANLYSIQESNPKASISVFWEDIPSIYIEPIKKTFKQVEFIETSINFSGDSVKRVASKTILWQMAVDTYPNEQIVLVDVDVLIIKNIAHFFKSNNFDILYTYKDEHYPLNTGVLLCNNSSKVQLFFNHWRLETLKILADKSLLADATNTNLCYGAPDQMSFYQMLNYDRKISDYIIQLDKKELKAKGVVCAYLNETNSTKITDSTHIIHYKGGWQPILIDGFGFTAHRPKNKSQEMFNLYIQTYCKAVEQINKITNNTYPSSFFKIKTPFYLNPKTASENKIKYTLFEFISWYRYNFKHLVGFLKKRM